VIKVFVLLLLSSIISSPATLNHSIENNSFEGHKPFRAYQGVATNGNYIYTSTDQDSNFKLEPTVAWDNNNIISVYDMNGTFINEKKEIYAARSKLGNFMSLGDITYIDGFLFGTVYDRNPPFESRVLKISLPKLEVVNVYTIGDGLAENITKHGGYYWVVHHNNNQVKQLDQNFKLVKTHVMSESPPVNAGYQGAFWIGDYFYANLHGANLRNEFYAPGLDKYRYDGHNFVFIERIKPPTYGAGQGVEFYKGKVYWSDRPENRIVITEFPMSHEKHGVKRIITSIMISISSLFSPYMNLD